MILFGAGASLLIPGLPTLPDPRQTPLPWELVSELTVIVALFGAGMRIDSLRPWKRWGPTLRMLGIAMPLTIFAVACSVSGRRADASRSDRPGGGACADRSGLGGEYRWPAARGTGTSGPLRPKQ